MKRLQLRRDTTLNWETSNPVLAQGEPGFDVTNNKLKIGDGTTAWIDLQYSSSDTKSLNTVTSIMQQGVSSWAIDKPQPVSGSVAPILGSGPDPNFPSWYIDYGWRSNLDDEYITFSLPFGFTINGAKETTIYLGSNNYITFGRGSEAYQMDDSDLLGLTRFMFGSGGRSLINYEIRNFMIRNFYTHYTIRYEGYYSSSSQEVTDVFEITFHNPEFNNNLNIIELRVGMCHENTRTGVSMIAGPNDEWSTSYTLNENTSYVFVGNEQGNSWTAYEGYKMSYLPVFTSNDISILGAFDVDFMGAKIQDFSQSITGAYRDLLTESTNTRVGVGCKYCHWFTSDYTTVEGFDNDYDSCPDCGNDISWFAKAIIMTIPNNQFDGGPQETGSKFDNVNMKTFLLDEQDQSLSTDWVRTYDGNDTENTLWTAYDTYPASIMISYLKFKDYRFGNWNANQVYVIAQFSE